MHTAITHRLRRRLPLLFVAACLVFTGCMPEEDPIAPYDRGDIRHGAVAMEPDYRYRVYFDLGGNRETARRLITDWDLGFSCSDSLPVVTLNTAKIMAAADAGSDFASVGSISGLRWRYDSPSGHADSTAIGRWWADGDGFPSRGRVYVIDRGVDAAGKHLGYRKVMITGYENNVYTVRFARLDGSEDTTLVVAQDSRYNVVGLSFDNGGRPVFHEPPADTWDIVFTRYTHIFYMPERTPYSVTGVLVNTGGTVVAVDSLRPFDEITAEHIDHYTFSTATDAVGYSWKTFYLDRGEYVIHPQIVYILRDGEGFYYKLHFTDFYNDTGEKGTPTFEYRTL